MTIFYAGISEFLLAKGFSQQLLVKFSSAFIVEEWFKKQNMKLFLKTQFQINQKLNTQVFFNPPLFRLLNSQLYLPIEFGSL